MAFESVEADQAYMSEPRPNRISELRKRRGLSQPQLAEKVDAHWVTISKLERGQMQLTQDWMVRLADALDVAAIDLLYDEPAARVVSISGIIDEKGIVGASFKKSRNHNPPIAPYWIDDTSINGQNTVWHLVGTQAMRPFFGNGDLIRFTYIEAEDRERCIGRLSLIETSEPISREIVGVPSRAQVAGCLDIQVFGAGQLVNVPVRRAAVASMAFFGPGIAPEQIYLTSR